MDEKNQTTVTEREISNAEQQRLEMLKKAKAMNLNFDYSDLNKKSAGLEVISFTNCKFKEVSNNKIGFFGQKIEIVISVIMFMVSFIFPLVILTGGKVVGEGKFALARPLLAIGFFLLLQGLSLLFLNVIHTSSLVFDKKKNKYYEKRGNHLYTRFNRKSILNEVNFNDIVEVQVTSFPAKRYDRESKGTGNNKYYVQKCVEYINSRISLLLNNGTILLVQDYKDQDLTLKEAEIIANFLQKPLNIV